jgi:hypothetical protein
MKSMSRVIVCLLALTVLSATAACKDEEGPTNEDADLKTLARMEADIDLYIGDAACQSADDCRTLPFGEKPCGGPWSYKVFSITATDSVALAGMINRYNEFNLTLNERHGWMSDCMYVGPPEIGCSKGSCAAVLNAAKQGAQ